MEEIKKCISKIKEQYMIPVYSLDFYTGSSVDNDIQFSISDQLFLETLSMEIRGKTISFSAYKKKQREQQEKN